MWTGYEYTCKLRTNILLNAEGFRWADILSWCMKRKLKKNVKVAYTNRKPFKELYNNKRYITNDIFPTAMQFKTLLLNIFFPFP